MSVTVWLFNCCVSFHFLKVLRKDHFFENFRSVDELSSVDRIYPNSARFELELDGPMWFLFTRPRTPQRLQFSISCFIGIRHCFLNCPYTFFSFSRNYLSLIVSNVLTVWCIEFWCFEYWWAKFFALSKIQTCAGRPHLSSSQTPLPLGHDCMNEFLLFSVWVILCWTAVWTYSVSRYYLITLCWELPVGRLVQ